MVLFLDLLPFLFQREKRDKDIDIIGCAGDVTKGSKASSTKHEKNQIPHQTSTGAKNQQAAPIVGPNNDTTVNDPKAELTVPNGGMTNHFNNDGNRANKQVQGVNAYNFQIPHETSTGAKNQQAAPIVGRNNDTTVNEPKAGLTVPNGGMINHFNNSGNQADKQVQGVNAYNFTL